LDQLHQLDQLDHLVQSSVGADLRCNFESHHTKKIVWGFFRKNFVCPKFFF
jgi:hypothetical protein